MFLFQILPARGCPEGPAWT